MIGCWNVSSHQPSTINLSDSHAEVFRVQWLRAKAIKDCFKEEVVLLKAEMGWTVNYFHNQSLNWKALYNAVDSNRGCACIAAKESAAWEKLKEYTEQIAQTFKITRATTRICT